MSLHFCLHLRLPVPVSLVCVPIRYFSFVTSEQARMFTACRDKRSRSPLNQFVLVAQSLFDSREGETTSGSTYENSPVYCVEMSRSDQGLSLSFTLFSLSSRRLPHSIPVSTLFLCVLSTKNSHSYNYLQLAYIYCITWHSIVADHRMIAVTCSTQRPFVPVYSSRLSTSLPCHAALLPHICASRRASLDIISSTGVEINLARCPRVGRHPRGDPVHLLPVSAHRHEALPQPVAWGRCQTRSERAVYSCWSESAA